MILDSKPARPRVVISAVNLVEGGTLRVLQRFTQAARTALPSHWEIIALVHDERLLAVPGVRLMAFPLVKRSWLRRVWFEYWQCRRLSRDLRADVWVALHDMTPVVRAKRQLVYCHNPAPFYPIGIGDAILDWKLLAFRLLYGALYRINLHRNYMIVVQQDWLRNEFRRRWGAKNVVVARPVADEAEHAVARKTGARQGCIYLYPTLPRPHKNVEVICEAVRRLEGHYAWSGEVRITISGKENKYARKLVAKYGNLRGVRFIGVQNADSMRQHYDESDCLVFSSRRETWGLPLTEAKQHGLFILAADMPYARESVGLYDGVDYFPVDDDQMLAAKMLAFNEGRLASRPTTWSPPAEPYAKDWASLIDMIANDVSSVHEPVRGVLARG